MHAARDAMETAPELSVAVRRLDPWIALFVGALTAAATWLCFVNLHGRGLRWDEIATWHDALSGHRNPQEAPLTDWLCRAVMTVLHRNDDYALHVAGACCGVLTIPAAFLLGLTCNGRLTGCIAALLACLSPTLLRFAQDARPYPLLILTTTLLLTVAVRLSRLETRPDLVAFAALSTTAAATHLVALPFIGALMGVLGAKYLSDIVRSRRRDAVVRLVRFIVMSGIAIAVGASWTLFRPPFTTVMTGHYTLGVGRFIHYVLSRSGPLVLDAMRPLDRHDVTLAAYVTVALIGAGSMARSGRGWALACVVLAPLATLTGLYLQLGDKSTWDWFRYATPAVVPLLTLVAAGLAIGSWRKTAVVIGFFVVLCQADVRQGLHDWAVETKIKRNAAVAVAARRIASDPRFVGTIFAPALSRFGDESDRLIAEYALVRRDGLPSYYAPWEKPLLDIEWRRIIGPLRVPIRTEHEAGPLAPGVYAVFLGWDSYRGCAYLSAQLQDPSPPVAHGTFIPCIVPADP